MGGKLKGEKEGEEVVRCVCAGMHVLCWRARRGRAICGRLQWQFSQMGLLPDVCVIRILG